MCCNKKNKTDMEGVQKYLQILAVLSHSGSNASQKVQALCEPISVQTGSINQCKLEHVVWWEAKPFQKYQVSKCSNLDSFGARLKVLTKSKGLSNVDDRVHLHRERWTSRTSHKTPKILPEKVWGTPVMNPALRTPVLLPDSWQNRPGSWQGCPPSP